MTDTHNAALQPLPENSEAADKIIRKKVMIFTVVVVLLLFVGTIGTPLLIAMLHMRPSSPAAFFVDIVSVGIIMAIFFTGANMMARTLLTFGRNFIERSQWEDAEYMLTSFNNWGQHFLDATGEAHYLLSVALQKRGKVETARKVRQFLVKHRSQSEWAQRIEAEEKGRSAPSPRTTMQDKASKSSKPSKTKRRRF